MLSIIYLIENSYSILDRIVYSTVLAIILFGISYFYEKYKNKIVIGAGDIKLIFVLSLLLNVIDSMLALWVSSLIGLLAVVLFNIKDFSNLKTIKIPFGLYLSIGFTIVYLWNLKTGSVELESMLLSLWQMK
jgi:prepilin signal peptidase PulO-like enzyme (type II secretory pathway)